MSKADPEREALHLKVRGVALWLKTTPGESEYVIKSAFDTLLKAADELARGTTARAALPDHEALIEQLRSTAAAYPEDVFRPLDEEDKKHPLTIQRASASMGRHMAPLLLKAAAALSPQPAPLTPNSAQGDSIERAGKKPEAVDGERDA